MGHGVPRTPTDLSLVVTTTRARITGLWGTADPQNCTEELWAHPARWHGVTMPWDSGCWRGSECQDRAGPAPCAGVDALQGLSWMGGLGLALGPRSSPPEPSLL